MRHVVAKKMMVYLLLVSVVVTILGTTFQLYLDHKNHKQRIADMIRHIEVTYMPSISNSLWMLDEDALKIQLEGLLKDPDIIYLEIKNSLARRISTGVNEQEHTLSKEFPLFFYKDDETMHLGTLMVVFTMKNILRTLWDRSVIILFTESFKILILSIFIFFLFYNLVGRHLESMAEYAQGLDYQNLSMGLVLRKKKKSKDGVDDEIDMLANAINEMRMNIEDYFGKMFKYQEELITTNQQLLGAGVELRNKQVELERTLREKTVLLQEVHHRVKNNLQVMASIISLQASRLENPETIKIFNDLRGRIHSMASVHDQLYREERFSDIEFSEYIRNISADLFRLYSITSDRIALDLDVSVGAIALDQAVPCALMLNEMITNCLKYAFPDGREGVLAINFALNRADNMFVLCVKDNGIGLPHAFNANECTSLGMTLLNALVTQLNGSLEIESNNGTSFSIKFPKKD